MFTVQVRDNPIVMTADLRDRAFYPIHVGALPDNKVESYLRQASDQIRQDYRERITLVATRDPALRQAVWFNYPYAYRIGVGERSPQGAKAFLNEVKIRFCSLISWCESNATGSFLLGEHGFAFEKEGDAILFNLKY